MVTDTYPQFLEKLLSSLIDKKVDVTNMEMDHIGYQTSSSEEYERLLPEFTKLGPQVREALVNGRRVAIYKLNDKLKYKNFVISAVELVEPTSGQSGTSGWEHAEFVIKDSFDDFLKKYPNVDGNTSAISQDTFPMIKLKIGNGLQAKFHLKPVLEIISNL